MRLSHIKLAGFKSFVEPTHFHLPGQIVGIVGPNGCGKSNVIDALRWVLGESKASALRGESMQDVIFNGSAQRKAVARASVELLFDNSLGKAAGQWSSYAEIAIKRVLLRNGESSYFINNQKVRRRDITDIFLGTGLGARAYAIVEQGMISRIIEAKPEELRVFLEEAAGVSKYRERRRETALRLNDTRDNLLRVGDILQEMEHQLVHLTAQAETARQYRELEKQRDTAQQLLCMLKKQQAEAARHGFVREISLARTELEAQTAVLREVESRLETLRSSHYQLTDALTGKQGELYAANSELGRIEQQISFTEAQQQRLKQQLELGARQLELQQQQALQAQTQLEHWQRQQGAAAVRFIEAEQQADAANSALPQAEIAARQAQENLHQVRSNQSALRQRLQLEDAQHANLQRTLAQLEVRRARLLLEQDNLPQPEEGALILAQEELAELSLLCEEQAQRQADWQAQLPDALQTRQQHQARLQQQERTLAQAEARLETLQQVQRQLDGDQTLNAWRHRHQLGALPHLWQSLRIESGWEIALEAVLRERLNALSLANLNLAADWADTPPARLALFSAIAAPLAATAMPPVAGLNSLLAVLESHDVAVLAVLQEWLAGVFTVADVAQGIALRAQLPDGGCFVTPQGHLVGRCSVLFHAPDNLLDGVLARQREIAQIECEIILNNQIVSEFSLALAQSASQCSEIETRLLTSRAAIATQTQRQHALQMQIQKLHQLQRQRDERATQITHELQELAAALTAEWQQQAEIKLQKSLLNDAISEFQLQLDTAQHEASLQDRALAQQRERAAKLQHELHEAQFFTRSCSEKIADSQEKIRQLAAARVQLEQQLHALRAEVNGVEDDQLYQQRQWALENRKLAEAALSEARNGLEQAASELQNGEQTRQRGEQRLQAGREKLAELALKEQEARLYFEQWDVQLQGVDEQALLPQLATAQPEPLQSEHQRLVREIEGLGAVNLAALDELQQAGERKNYLEAQAADLQQAMATLLDAIRHIDRESRSLLMDTFNQVNVQLAELFPVLFAGGEARLVLTGEEILDSGVQVMAQPPGKKNSSIHLLSGGEKALTAIALIFSLFQLNPAPFCLLDEVDAPLDDSNTERLCALVKKMAQHTQFVFISHNKIAMEMAQQLIGVTMQEKGVSRVVSVDIEAALRLREEVGAV